MALGGRHLPGSGLISITWQSVSGSPGGVAANPPPDAASPPQPGKEAFPAGAAVQTCVMLLYSEGDRCSTELDGVLLFYLLI